MKKSFRKLKGIWNKAGGVTFKSTEELRTWRISLWLSTEQKLRNMKKKLLKKSL